VHAGAQRRNTITLIVLILLVTATAACTERSEKQETAPQPEPTVTPYVPGTTIEDILQQLLGDSTPLSTPTNREATGGEPTVERVRPLNEEFRDLIARIVAERKAVDEAFYREATGGDPTVERVRPFTRLLNTLESRCSDERYFLVKIVRMVRDELHLRTDKEAGLWESLQALEAAAALRHFPGEDSCIELLDDTVGLLNASIP